MVTIGIHELKEWLMVEMDSGVQTIRHNVNRRESLGCFG